MTILAGARPPRSKAHRRTGVVPAAASLRDAMRRAARGERTIVRQHGKRLAAVVPVEDAQYMQALEDAHDVAVAEAALRDIRSGRVPTIPWEEVRRKCGLR